MTCSISGEATSVDNNSKARDFRVDNVDKGPNMNAPVLLNFEEKFNGDKKNFDHKMVQM